MTTNHAHRAEEEDGDECVDCGQLFCPDTRTTVTYDGRSNYYWHRDGSTCFLHQRTEAELVSAGAVRPAFLVFGREVAEG